MGRALPFLGWLATIGRRIWATPLPDQLKNSLGSLSPLLSFSPVAASAVDKRMFEWTFCQLPNPTRSEVEKPRRTLLLMHVSLKFVFPMSCCSLLLQVFLKLRLITTYLWTLEGYFDDSVVPAGNRRLCDPVVKSGSCCGFDNQLDSMTFINAGIFKKHYQRHNGSRILSPKLELSLKAETNANSNLAL